MAKKQYYIPGKEYEWTKETWDTVLKHMRYILAGHYGPFATDGGNVKGSTRYECEGKSYIYNLDLCWEFVGNEKYWRFSVSEEGVEIPEYLIQFYGEKEKEEKMSNRFKFEGAPDDATHYCPEVERAAECWVKYTDGEVLFSYGKEFTWRKWPSGGADVEHFFIPRPKKEILTVDDLEVGQEYIMCLGVNEEQHIIYWAKNQEVIFITNLLYHTYEHAFIKDVPHFREVPEKTREQELSEKYNVSVDTIKKMMQDGLIKEGE